MPRCRASGFRRALPNSTEIQVPPPPSPPGVRFSCSWIRLCPSPWSRGLLIVKMLSLPLPSLLSVSGDGFRAGSRRGGQIQRGREENRKTPFAPREGVFFSFFRRSRQPHPLPLLNCPQYVQLLSSLSLLVTFFLSLALVPTFVW